MLEKTEMALIGFTLPQQKVSVVFNRISKNNGIFSCFKN